MALVIVLPCLAPRDPPEFVSVKTDKAKSSDLWAANTAQNSHRSLMCPLDAGGIQ